ncbi:MAG: prepilin-type N-terminal cleavage/methylation domain-containing protein [Planctomycetes bacterium]|nr:prepilin-type N-terminal cleavage/methylation domain-containing protein [Planctomycetota bacterium]
MLDRCRNSGFSLTEVLISAGILAVGFMLIATVFPVGIHLTALSTERNIGATAADEAFAKLMIYGVKPLSLSIGYSEVYSEANLPNQTYLRLYMKLVNPMFDPATSSPQRGQQPIIDLLKTESLYPSIPDHLYRTDATAPDPAGADPELEPRYCWSALCKRTSGFRPRSVQATVFVSRRGVGAAKYPYWKEPDLANPSGSWTTTDRPVPVPVEVEASGTSPTDTIMITDSDLAGYITENSVLVNSRDGRVMVVLRVEVDRLTIVLKDKVFAFIPTVKSSCWVIPPAVKYQKSSDPPVVGGRYPCVEIYQRDLDF